MRITNKMILDQTVFNLSRAYSRFIDLQAIVSSGRRINKPSDDPVGCTRDLSYRTHLDELGQFNRNISRAKSLLNFTDYSLGSMTDYVIQAEDIAVQLSNDTYDDAARDAAAEQISDILDQILDTGNSTLESRYIFAGSNTRTAPFDFNGVGVVYRGNDDPLNFKLYRGAFLTGNISGAELLIKPTMTLGDGFDLNPGLSRTTFLSNLHGGDGVNLGDGHFTLRTLNGEADIDLTGALNIGDVIDEINAQAAAQGLSNLTVSISEAGNSLKFVDTSDPYLTVNTPLSMLNQGSGVDLTVPQFAIEDSDGNSYTIDVTGAAGLGDVIDAINGAGIPDLTASIEPGTNWITISDAVGHDYIIEESGAGTVAEDLGILTSSPIGGQFAGEDLQPWMIATSESTEGQTTAADLGIHFQTSQTSFDGDDLDPRLTLNTKITELRNGLGISYSMIHIVNGHDSFDIDFSTLQENSNATLKDLIRLIEGSGAQVDLRLNDDKTGIALESRVSGQSLVVYDTTEEGSASQLGIAGSPDLVGSLLYLRDGLERNWGDTAQRVIDRLQLGQGQLSSLRSIVGNRTNRAESAEAKNLNQEVYTTQLLSEVEDADMLMAITELSTQEVVYRAALAASARVLQPSLVNFLS